MTTHRAPMGAPFAMLAAAPCPEHGEMLVGLEREFRAVDRGALADRLDELARPLFGLASSCAREAAGEIAYAARAAVPAQGDDPLSWLLDCGLTEGRAASPVRAVLGVELARRAGVDAHPVRIGGRCLVAVRGGGSAMAADVGPDTVGPGSPAAGGSLCAHEVAFSVLGGLAEAWAAIGCERRARRAAGLRLLLPLDDQLKQRVLADVDRYS